MALPVYFIWKWQKSIMDIRKTYNLIKNCYSVCGVLDKYKEIVDENT